MSSGTETRSFKAIIGTDEAAVDDKGRVLIGKKKRERLGESFVIAVGSIGCLVAYPKPIWDERVNEMLSYNPNNVGREHFTRLTLGMADDEMKSDAQGRVVIPQKLREIARIKDRVLLIGCGDRLELWAASEWEIFNRMPESYGIERRESLQRAYDLMTSPDGK